MAVKGSNVPKEQLDLYKKLVSTDPQTELKEDTVPYTSLNGHMFSYINEGSLVLRLSEEDKAAFEKKYKGPGSIVWCDQERICMCTGGSIEKYQRIKKVF